MLKEQKIDTEAGMLSGISRKRSIRSRNYWFTEFCNSQCLSHFAAPFIVVRAETSVAENCMQCMHVWNHAGSIISANARLTIWQAEKREDSPVLASPTPELPGVEKNAFCQPQRGTSHGMVHSCLNRCVRMILPQVHLRKPCYDFSFL